jgi:hypothetical protein
LGSIKTFLLQTKIPDGETNLSDSVFKALFNVPMRLFRRPESSFGEHKLEKTFQNVHLDFYYHQTKILKVLATIRERIFKALFK